MKVNKHPIHLTTAATWGHHDPASNQAGQTVTDMATKQTFWRPLLPLLSIFILTIALAARASDGNILLLPVVQTPEQRPIGLRLTELAGGLTLPTVLVNAADERLFVAERGGKVKIIWPDGSLASEPFVDLSGEISHDPNNPIDEQGLLGVAFHPDYASNGHLFVSFTESTLDTPSGTRMVLARLTRSADDPNSADLNSLTHLLRVSQPTVGHNGGDLLFAADGTLYMSLGDGSSSAQDDPGNNAQNLSSLLGKIIRLDVDSRIGIAPTCSELNAQLVSVPPSNPYVEHNGACNEIWASGLRNPWRISFDHVVGSLLISDVGRWNWEEVNVEKPPLTGGANYGWRCYEGIRLRYPESCNDNTVYTPPTYAYQHDGHYESITGGHVYRGTQHPGFSGLYIYARFSEEPTLEAIDPYTPDPEPIFVQPTARWISTFGQDAAGELYVADYFDGTILRLVPRFAP